MQYGGLAPRKKLRLRPRISPNLLRPALSIPLVLSATSSIPRFHLRFFGNNMHVMEGDSSDGRGRAVLPVSVRIAILADIQDLDW